MDERRFARRISALGEIFEFVDRVAGTEAIGSNAAFDLRLAIEELFTNMVKYHPESRRDISIRIDREGPWVRATLQDFDVDSWDITQARRRDGDRDGSLEPGGRGLDLVRALTQDLTYDYRDRSSTVTFRLRAEG